MDRLHAIPLTEKHIFIEESPGTCHQLNLHPDGKVILAWVRSDAELKELCEKVSSARKDMGRVPVVAFTPQHHTWEKFQNPADKVLQDADEYLMLYEVSAREEQQLFPIGLSTEMCVGFDLRIKVKYKRRTRSLFNLLEPVGGDELVTVARKIVSLTFSEMHNEEQHEEVLHQIRQLIWDMLPPFNEMLISIETEPIAAKPQEVDEND